MSDNALLDLGARGSVSLLAKLPDPLLWDHLSSLSSSVSLPVLHPSLLPLLPNALRCLAFSLSLLAPCLVPYRGKAGEKNKAYQETAAVQVQETEQGKKKKLKDGKVRGGNRRKGF